MTLTLEQAHDHIASEGARYGLSKEEAINMIHPEVQAQATPEQLVDHWDSYDQSHIQAQSTNPELANDADNIFLEDASVNRARGADTATQAEIDDAWDEQVEDFHDQDYDDNGVIDSLEVA